MLVSKPGELPNLSGAPLLCFDLETKDPTLKELGPGVRRDGRVLGAAMAVEDGQSWYLPVDGQGIEPGKAWAWIGEQLAVERPVLGANLTYDLDYSTQNGCPIPKIWRDVLQAGRLLELQRKGWFPSLDYLLGKHLDATKTGDDLWVWLATVRGKGEPTRKAQIEHLDMAPVEMVAEYAEGDVRELPRLLTVLEAKLKERHAWDWYLVECELLPYLLEMRRRGVRVDVERARQLQTGFGEQYAELLEKFGGEAYPEIWAKLSGPEKTDMLKVNSAASLTKVYQTRGIKLPKTATGLSSITKSWLEAQEDSFSKMILQLRALSKVSGTFVDSYILKHEVNGRIHPELNPLFPVTLRFSSRNPNEQNIPNTEILAPMIRGLFLPEEGEDWGRHDYNQQEYRLLVHNAMGEGAEEARQAYRDDPKTNFHQLVWGWLQVVENYKTVKNANFCKVYRAGKQRFADTLGMSREEADPVFALYDQKLPFVRYTAEMAERIATERGYLKLLLKGMRMYFDLWAVDDWTLKNEVGWDHSIFARYFNTPEEAQAAVKEELPDYTGSVRVKKAEVYKALNRVIQPSGAQLMKYGMVLIRRSGVHDVLGAPLVSVHDELGFSVPRTAEGREAFAEAARIMASAGDEGGITVPLLIGSEIGPSWGRLEKFTP